MKEFIDGIIIKDPHPNAPDFVKYKISIRKPALIAWLNEQDGEWVNGDINVSRAGKPYIAVDDFKPEPAPPPAETPPPEDFDDDIPF